MPLMGKCSTCGAEREISSSGDWSSFIAHGKKDKQKRKHIFTLVDMDTGEELDRSPSKVREALAERGLEQPTEAVLGRIAAKQEAAENIELFSGSPVGSDDNTVDETDNEDEYDYAADEIDLFDDDGADLDDDYIGSRPGMSWFESNNSQSMQSQQNQPNQPPQNQTPMGITSDGRLRISIIVPPDAIVMYNLAMSKDFDGTGQPISFDEWVFDCIKARYELDYHHVICLQPIIN